MSWGVGEGVTEMTGEDRVEVGKQARGGVDSRLRGQARARRAVRVWRRGLRGLPTLRYTIYISILNR